MGVMNGEEFDDGEDSGLMFDECVVDLSLMY